MNLLVTGASGFIGRALIAQASVTQGFGVRAAVRSLPEDRLPNVEYIKVGDVASPLGWGRALSGVNVVVHTAARVHVMSESAEDPLASFRRVNVEGTMNVARTAVAAGVKRFVFLSSIKVNGERTFQGQQLSEDDLPNPVDAYAMSKHEAELRLNALAIESGLEVVVIRPVLVYGPGVAGNFATLMRVLEYGAPLPFGAIRNFRSFVSIGNLVNLILLCCGSVAAAGQTFLVSDAEDLSTPELMRRLAGFLGVRLRLFPVPVVVLLAVARIARKIHLMRRICHSLRVDTTKARDLLGWSPSVSMDESLALMAREYQRMENR